MTPNEKRDAFVSKIVRLFPSVTTHVPNTQVSRVKFVPSGTRIIFSTGNPTDLREVARLANCSDARQTSLGFDGTSVEVSF